MPRIIKYKSTDDLAKTLADNNIQYCNSVIYCKSEAEANVYYEMIIRFADGIKGVDHLYGNIALCIDPDSTKIAGMHLLSYKIPNNVKSSYPFQLQAKKIGQEKQDEILKACGLNTEKELKAIWEYCAGRLSFPIEATADEKKEFSEIFENAGNIILLRKENKNKKVKDDVNQKAEIITQWFTDNFSNNFERSDFYVYRKTWKVTHCINGYKTFLFLFRMECSETQGITSFYVCYPDLDFSCIIPWSQDENIDNVLKKAKMMWDQFSVIVEAISKTREIAAMTFEVPQN